MPQGESPRSVVFQPEGTRVTVPSGTSILEAARRAGVPIDSVCGGEGTCGRCRVIVRQGEVEGGGDESFTEDEDRTGYVMACQARPAGDVTVEVPSESRVRTETVEFRRGAETPAAAGKPGTPVARRISVKVPEPTLEYNRADLERLAHALRDAGEKEMIAGLEVTRRLPGILRESGHDVTVLVACREGRQELIDVSAGNTSGRNFAVAVDLGTTTVVAEMVDLGTGSVLGSATKYNSQAVYGADVIRRIMWASENHAGLRQLQLCVRNDVNALIGELTAKTSVKPDEVGAMTAAGNTTMTHLFLEMTPDWIRRDPYIGVTYHPPSCRAAELGLAINPGGILCCLPCVSSFVGGDITAGVLATGLARAEKPWMLIDMGTNGEIVIGNREWMVCASASAGPAFEGAGTRHGMRAMGGAIDHVTGVKPEGGFEYTTIDDRPPAGLCGTAYIDLLVHLLRAGAVDKTGRFNESKVGTRLRKGSDGLPEYVVVPAGEKGAPETLVITQPDLDNLLRAKGAIYATTKILLKSLGLKPDDLDRIMVAGAFGAHLNVGNAIAIGLLPDQDQGKIEFAGNTSAAGARMSALDCGALESSRRLADSMTYYELCADPAFMEEFTSACFLPHTNIEEFPSVRAQLSGEGERK